MAVFLGFARGLNRVLPSLKPINPIRQLQTMSTPLQFQVTTPLCGEPLKRKKRIDPAVLKRREDRKRKRIEKSIKRLTKAGRKLKPIDENEIPPTLEREISQRTRKLPELSEDEIRRRFALQKSWSRYKYNQHLYETQIISSMIKAQQRALEALREESEDLYQEAIQPDPYLLPYTCQGPTDTPPILDYECPDGDYVDTTNRFDKKLI